MAQLAVVITLPFAKMLQAMQKAGASRAGFSLSFGSVADGLRAPRDVDAMLHRYIVTSRQTVAGCPFVSIGADKCNTEGPNLKNAALVTIDGYCIVCPPQAILVQRGRLEPDRETGSPLRRRTCRAFLAYTSLVGVCKNWGAGTRVLYTELAGGF